MNTHFSSHLPFPENEGGISLATGLAYERLVSWKLLRLLGIDDFRELRPGQQIEMSMTVLFCDIRDFTSLSENMTPQENFDFLNAYLMRMEPVITAHGGIIDKYVGDAIMAIFPSSPGDALRCSLAMLAALDEFNATRYGHAPVRVGIGINTGIVMLGIIGSTIRMDGTVIGDVVNLAARLEYMTKEYRVPVLVSEHTLSSLDDPAAWPTRFLDQAYIRGKLDPQSVYELLDAGAPALIAAKKKTLTAFQHGLAHYRAGEFLVAYDRFSLCVSEALDDTVARMHLRRCQDRLDNRAIASVHEAHGSGADERMAWHPRYDMGVDVIDNGHQALLWASHELIRKAYKAGADSMTPLIDAVRQAAVHVFVVEERMMRQAGYPFIDIHSRQHRRFFGHLDNLSQQMAAGDADALCLAFYARTFLVDWLSNHILHADRHFFKSISFLKTQVVEVALAS